MDHKIYGSLSLSPGTPWYESNADSIKIKGVWIFETKFSGNKHYKYRYDYEEYLIILSRKVMKIWMCMVWVTYSSNPIYVHSKNWGINVRIHMLINEIKRIHTCVVKKN